MSLNYKRGGQWGRGGEGVDVEVLSTTTTQTFSANTSIPQKISVKHLNVVVSLDMASAFVVASNKII